MNGRVSADSMALSGMRRALCILGCLALGVVFVLVVVWRGRTDTTCTKQSRAYITSIEEALRKWDDTGVLMSSTPRIALGPVVASLQEQRRSMEAIAPPECARMVHRRLVEYMGHEIDFALAFMASKPHAEFMEHQDKAKQDLDAWAKEFAALKLGIEPYGNMKRRD